MGGGAWRAHAVAAGPQSVCTMLMICVGAVVVQLEQEAVLSSAVYDETMGSTLYLVHYVQQQVVSSAGEADFLSYVSCS